MNGEAAARCRAVCEDLVAGRRPPPVPPPDQRLLRHLLREQGLSGLAARAIEAAALPLATGVAAGIGKDWSDARSWAAKLDLESARIGGTAADASRSLGLSPPLLLKGPAVARRYQDPSLRTYVDIDLLVPVDEIRPWAEALAPLGWWASKPDLDAARRRHKESVTLVQRRGDLAFDCDLHTCLFIERRARDLGYATLAGHSQPSPFPGLLEPSAPGQLLILALHLVHHPVGARRLVWLRDFIELGDGPAVTAARALAAHHGVGWALERALWATEQVVGHPAWGAAPPGPEPFGLARVHQLDRTGYLRHLALARELGPLAGGQYLASRLDPRRFAAPGTRFDATVAWSWATLAAKRVLATPWRQGLARRRRR